MMKKNSVIISNHSGFKKTHKIGIVDIPHDIEIPHTTVYPFGLWTFCT